MNPNEAFLDTSYLIALASVDDDLHKLAISLIASRRLRSVRLVTTRAVLLELGNALSKQRYREPAVKLLEGFEQDPNVEIVPLSEDLYIKALDLFKKRPDKEWGLVDCVSFVVMQERGITDALTSDEHFSQAGFNALLRAAT